MFNKDESKTTITKANCILALNRRIVGVKFLFTEEEFLQAEAKRISGKIHYCVMAKSAMAGNSIKAAAENFGCPGSARALGIMEPEEFFRSGRHYVRLGLYRDLTTAKQIRNNMTLCEHKAYGVVLKPLEEFSEEPDIVLIVADSYNSMRIVQGYTYSYGIYSSFKMSGNQAICSECTAYPFESNNINISVLCAGTRDAAGWTVDELGIGIPYNRFTAVIEGVYQTINPIEPNCNKEQIEEKLKKNGFSDLAIEFDKNYFTTAPLKGK